MRKAPEGGTVAGVQAGMGVRRLGEGYHGRPAGTRSDSGADIG
jgi:hypothetical protein